MGLLITLAVAVTLSVPGRANSTPTVSADGSFVTVTWSASTSSGATDVYVAVSRDAGRTFGAPVKVSDTDTDARVNGEQPPQAALVPQTSRDPLVDVVWTTKGAKGTKLVHAKSTDGGKTFAAPALVPGSDADGNRGWEAAARTSAIWLDHRELADPAMATMHHEHMNMPAGGAQKPDGVAQAQKSKLYFASLDGAVAPHAITGGVCYCCKTALVAASDGAIYAAWRHVYPGNLRDIAFTVSRDGGRTFASPLRVSEDKWMLEGCPDDGPAMAVDGQKRVHLVWPTLVTDGGEPTIGIFYATSSDGRGFSARERIPARGTPHHPRIALDGRRVILLWDELENGVRRVVAASRAGDRGPFTRQVLSDAVTAMYPAAASASSGVVVAWTSGKSSDSTIRVLTLRQPAGDSAGSR
jgi:hypothetical protein